MECQIKFKLSSVTFYFKKGLFIFKYVWIGPHIECNCANILFI